MTKFFKLFIFQNFLALLVLCLPGSLRAQESVSGSVTSSDGEPLIGVSIVIKGSARGTISDYEGKFSLQAGQNDTLTFSYVGYITREIIAGSQNELHVVLQENTKMLNEVVITGFQKLSKEKTVGSFSTMGSEALDRIIAPNLLDKLEGQLAGVSVQNGKLVIRGANTFNQGNTNEISSSVTKPDAGGIKLADGTVVSYRNDPSAPIIVLDGFQYTGDINDLDPNDIENITVLKDASSSSVWGTQAANGVIVITRKKYREEGLMITYNNQFSISDRPSIAAYNFAPAHVALDVEKFAYDHLGMNSSLANRRESLTALQKILYQRDVAGQITYPQAEYMIDSLRQNSNYNELMDLVFQNAASQNHALQLRNRSRFMTNILAVNYTSKSGSGVGDNTDKFDISLRNNIRIGRHVHVDLNYTTFMESALRNSMSGYVSGGRIRPYEKIYDEKGGYAPMFNSRGVAYHIDEMHQELGYLPWSWNLAQELHNKDNSTKSRADILQIGTNFRLPYNFKFTSNFQFQSYGIDQVLFYNEQTHLTRDMVNTFTTYEELFPGYYTLTHNVPIGGGFRQNVRTERAVYNWRNQLNYDKTIDEKHYISVLLGTDYSNEKTDYQTNSILGYNPVSGLHGTSYVNLKALVSDPSLSLPYTYDQQPHQISNFVNSNGFNRYVDFSYYGIVGYEFDEKYHFTGSARVDQSNLFSDAGQNFLWSAGAGWSVSQEPFFKRFSNRVALLKLRGSYGFTGNVDRSAIPFLRGQAGFFPDNQNDYLEVREPSNPNLKMERTRNINLGLDVSLRGADLNIQLDYYDNFSTNLIVSQRTDPTHKGWSSGKVNSGSLQNRGVELSLNGTPYKGAVLWATALNFSYNQNTVVDFQVDNTAAYYAGLINGSSKVPGYALNHIFSYNYQGVDENGHANILIGESLADPTILDPERGLYLNGYEAIGLEDLVYAGSSVPLFTGGYYNSLTFKGFTVGFNILYELGHYMRMPTADIMAANATQRTPYKDIANAWSMPGDELRTNIPRLTGTTSNNDPIFVSSSQLSNNLNWYVYGHTQVEKGDNIRLSYINMRYVFPDKVLEKIRIGIHSLRINGQINNVGFWAANSRGYDPKYLNRPNPRSYTIAINATF